LNGIANWVFTILGIVLAAIGIWYARSQVIPGRRRQRRLDSFREVRAWMGELGSERKIVAAAHREHADLLAATPMNLFIADPAWVLPGPIDLDRLTVEVADEEDAPRVKEECYAPLRRYWPLGSDDRPVGRYHEAVTQSGTAPRIWFNAPSYRLLDAGRRADGGFALRVSTTTYWDGYDSWAARESPFRELERARLHGWVRPYLLDFGFDPVSWKAGVRLVCIFDEDAYLDIFRGMRPEGEEGQLELTSLHRIGDEPLEGMPFDEETVARYLKDPTITEAARFCIGMTWRHRESLGLAAPVY
jgi:hypothetical protein